MQLLPSTSSPLRRRILRGLEGLFAPFVRLNDQPAIELLSAEALLLFRKMSRVDQAHSLRVYRWLVQRGFQNQDLLVAALLHDCGKAAAKLSVWQRTLKVLLKGLSPNLWRTLAAPTPPASWRYPFFVLREHPRIGAEWAREAGCSDLACWLIAHHEETVSTDHPYADLLLALEYADAAS